MTSTARQNILLRWSLVAVAFAAVLALPSPSAAAPATSDGLQAYFDGEEGTTPLDLLGVRFGQTANTQLTLIMRTHKPWEPGLLNPLFGRSLCMLLRAATEPNPSGRLCAYPNETTRSGLSARYTVLAQDGTQLGIRDLSIRVARPNKTTVRMDFPPALLRLKPGLYHWRARSQYSDDSSACFPPAGCEDLLPNDGDSDLNVTLSVAPEAGERCFGAASRDRRRPCRNPRLSRKVVPTPDRAVAAENLPCKPLERDGLILPCEFGVPASSATKTVALIGDSHAAHWRAALEVVTQEFGWRGLSVTRAGCPLTKAVARLTPSRRRAECMRWNREVPRWLAKNPQISTVFVVAHVEAGVVVKNSRNQFAAKMAGFKRAWRGLPKSVTRVIVIRDTPKSAAQTLQCVRRAMARRRRPGLLCSLPRRSVLRRDAAAIAANKLRSPRVRAIDMTSFFCSRRRCYPVIGGALVYKDVTHLTDVFTTSLGPYLVRKIRSLDRT